MAKSPAIRRKKTRQFPVLVIEDNADQWLITRAVLTKCFPEVEPVWINNTPQAITYLEGCANDVSKLPILILSDLYMPRREDGLQILEFIKNHTFLRKPPVVVLSSSQDSEDIAQAYSFCGVSYIVKPGTFHEWVNSFYTFRRYWWELASLPAHAQKVG